MRPGPITGVLLLLAVPSTAQGRSVPALAESSILIPGFASLDSEYATWVALEGDLAAVGAPRDNLGEGSVFCYEASSGTLLVEIEGPGSERAFGHDLALQDGVLLTGAYFFGSGTAFLADVASGTVLGPLAPPGLAFGDGYGFSSDQDGTLALIGALGDDVAASQAGAAYLLDPSSGQVLHELRARDATPQSYLGFSVAVDGELAVAGAIDALDDRGVRTGAVYVFDTASGAQLHKLTPAAGTEGERFGYRLELSGHDLIVGVEPFDPLDPGRAYLFDAFTGEERFVLQPGTPPGFGDGFGSAVTIDGPWALVGAPLSDVHGVDRGTAYLYEVASGERVAELWPSQAVEGSRFGSALALDGDHALVGAPLDQEPGFAPGRAYWFELEQLGAPGEEYCPGRSCPCGNEGSSGGCASSAGPEGARLSSQGTPSVGRADLALRLEDAPPSRPALVFMGAGTTALPFGDGLRCVAGEPLCRFPIGTTDVSGSLVFGDLVQGSADLGPGCAIEPGARWNFQAWYRDPGGPCGSGFNLSSARSVLFAP